MKKILVAEDSPTIQKVVQLCFADEPFELQLVQEGDRALELLQTWRPDILLADALMPGTDGYTLCKVAKQENKIPVILLVGTFEPFDFGRAEESGYDAYLTKPFDTANLLKTVTGLVGPSAPEEPRSVKESRTLEFETQRVPKKPGVLEIEEFRLSHWGYEIVPQQESPLPPFPVHQGVKSGNKGLSLNLEAEVTEALKRLVPRWMENMRKDLLEELGRSNIAANGHE